jgi:hypothetical protein
MDTWSARSTKNWKIAVALPLLKLYPELAALPDFEQHN